MNKKSTSPKYIAFEKAVRVINSCLTLKQLMVATKYAHFHLKLFNDEVMYMELLLTLKKRQKSSPRLV